MVMQYIILIGDESLTLDSVKNINHCDSSDTYDVPSARARYWVSFGEDYVYYDFDYDVDGYEGLLKVPYKNPKSITMVYNSKERVKQVLKQDNFLKGIYVDDDADNILPIEDYIKILDQLDSSRAVA